MIAVADTTPLNYLVLIHRADLLHQLFGRVLIPPAVFAELRDPEAPPLVQTWIADPPPWLEVLALGASPDSTLDYLDSGEREAVALAEQLCADQLLIDETEARREATRRKLPFTGTLGVASGGPAGVGRSSDGAHCLVSDYLVCGPGADTVSAGRRGCPQEAPSLTGPPREHR